MNEGGRGTKTSYGAEMKLYFSAAMKPQTNSDKAAVKDSRSAGNWRQGASKNALNLEKIVKMKARTIMLPVLES